MTDRWRGRSAGLAITALLVVLVTVTTASRSGPALLVRGPDGDVLATVPLPGGEFTLRYRNSVYRSAAEEHYTVAVDGRIGLSGLAADELAVLEEYYAIDDPAWRATSGTRSWQADPARPVTLDRLMVAATDLGRRTLLVEGRAPLELWRLVDDRSPSVTLEVAGG